MEKLSVVLLNFNGRHHLETFLPSVVAHSGTHGVYVVDNGSTDDSVNFVKSNYPKVRLICFNENNGFCGGYNKAIPFIDSEYIVLLNTDVEVSPNWIEPILEILENQPKIKAVQPRILDYKNKEYFEYAGAAGGFIDVMGYPFCRGRIFETIEKADGKYLDQQKIFWASGSCLFIHRQTYLNLGGLDEKFFAHMEEIDLCWRIWNSGHEVAYCPGSTVYHLGGGTLNKSKPKKTYLNFRNGLSLLIKNEPFNKLWWKLPLRIALDWTAVLKFSLQSGPKHGLAILNAHLSTLLSLPQTIKKRQRKRSATANIPIFKGFIAWQYFVKGRRKYSDLP